MLYNYSVTPLKEDHFEERCEDIVKLVTSKAITMPLFRMTLVPEGNPVMNKVGPMVNLYARYRDALERRGINCGILVQASLGHGYNLIPNPFQKYTNVIDGKECFVCCPEDENFIRHFCEVLKILAKERPKAIMLDDDFRLMMRPGRGCACPLHMQEFNKRTSLNMTREQLAKHIFTHNENDPLTDVFRDIQRDSLIKAVTAFREAIDSVDSSIQGINCASGQICESVTYTNKIFAGENNPTIVRIGGGSYAPFGIRGFSTTMRDAAIRCKKMKKAGIDIILAETDTIPHNRYAKSANHLHAQYASAILEGVRGAKHWITRMTAYEPAPLKAYGDILAENYGLYEKLAEYSKEIKWTGCCQGFIEQEKVLFNREKYSVPFNYTWTEKVLERMGIPFYFSDDGGNAVFLEGDIAADMTDEQIEKVFEGSVFVDGKVAQELVRRGYGALLGVDIEEWDLGLVSAEIFDVENDTCCTVQKNLKKITIVTDGVEALSYNYLNKAEQAEILAPAVTVYRRDDGKISVVYCGSPDAEFVYTEGFAFLNESRKNQFIRLLKEANALPIYCVGDEEICLRAGYVADGRMLVTAYKVGIDPLDSLKVYIEKEPESISMLDNNGHEQMVAFEDLGNNIYEIKEKLDTLYPLILLIKQ